MVMKKKMKQKKKLRWGKKANVLHSIAFTQITTSDWSISDDCVNVVYNQWLKKENFKYNMFLYYIDSCFGIWGYYYMLQMLYFLDQF